MDFLKSIPKGIKNLFVRTDEEINTQTSLINEIIQNYDKNQIANNDEIKTATNNINLLLACISYYNDPKNITSQKETNKILTQYLTTLKTNKNWIFTKETTTHITNKFITDQNKKDIDRRANQIRFAQTIDFMLGSSKNTAKNNSKETSEPLETKTSDNGLHAAKVVNANQNAGSSASPCKETQPIKAADCAIGSMMSGAGQLWRVVIDPTISDKCKRKFFVPADTRLYVSKALSFDEEGRRFCLPPHFSNKHRFLPLRKRTPPPAPKPLPIANMLATKEDIKQFNELKSEAKRYVCQRNKFMTAKTKYEAARCEMDTLMGIESKERLQELAQQVNVVKNQLQSCKQKIQEFEQAKLNNDTAIANARQIIESLQLKMSKAQANGDQLSVGQLNTQLCNYKEYLQKVNAYRESVQQNINLLNAVNVKLMEKEEKLTKDVAEKTNTRVRYRGLDDIRAAQQDVNDCQQRLTYLQEKLTTTETNLATCSEIIDKAKANTEALEGGALFGNPGQAFAFTKTKVCGNLDDANMQIKNLDSITNEVTEKAEAEKVRVCKLNQPKLKALKEELESLVTEAEFQLKETQQKKKEVEEQINTFKQKEPSYDPLGGLKELCPPAAPTNLQSLNQCFPTMTDKTKEITGSGDQTSAELKAGKETIVERTNNGNENKVDIKGGLTWTHIPDTEFNGSDKALVGTLTISKDAQSITIEEQIKVRSGMVNKLKSYVSGGSTSYKLVCKEGTTEKTYDQNKDNSFECMNGTLGIKITKTSKESMTSAAFRHTRNLIAFAPITGEYFKSQGLQYIQDYPEILQLVEIGEFNADGKLKDGYQTYTIANVAARLNDIIKEATNKKQSLSKQRFQHCISLRICEGKPSYQYVGQSLMGIIPDGYGVSNTQYTPQKFVGNWLLGSPYLGKGKVVTSKDDKKQTTEKTGLFLFDTLIQEKSLDLQMRQYMDEAVLAEKACEANRTLMIAYNWTLKYLTKQMIEWKDTIKNLDRKSVVEAQGFSPAVGDAMSNVLLGGESPAAGIDRLYSVAGQIQHCAHNRNRDELAFMHLSAGRLLHSMESQLENQRRQQVQMDAQHAQQIARPEGMQLMGGATDQFRQTQALISDFRTAAVQSLNGGLHRKILGGKIADQLISIYLD